MSDHDPSRIGGSGRNRAVFDSVDLVGSYNPDGGLTPAEDRLIGAWVPPEPDVLDLGVGTGRTTPALRSIAGTAQSLSQNDKSPATRPDPCNRSRISIALSCAGGEPPRDRPDPAARPRPEPEPDTGCGSQARTRPC